MPILVDYACAACGGRSEIWVDSPVPAHATCPACGTRARRAWSPVGLARQHRITRDGPAPPVGEPAPGQRSDAPLCARNPDIPGLCHLSPEAARTAEDAGDIRVLAQRLGLHTAAEVLRVVESYYPPERLPVRTSLLLEEMFP